MKDVYEFGFGLAVAFCFCFTVFTIKSCTIEQEKLSLERLKIPHKIQRTNTATIESNGVK